MDQQQISKWQRIIGEEHAKRQEAEFKICALEEQLAGLQDQVRKSNQYANFMDSKLADLDVKYTNTSNTLHKIVAILKKAKLLIAKRKQEIQYLSSENAKLKIALQKKQALLQEQLLHNEQHDRQVVELQRKINNLQNQLYAKQRGNTEIEIMQPHTTNHDLADYFAYKIISAPDKSATGIKSETDFIAQINFLEQRAKQ